MTATSASKTPPVDSRSPFVRLTDLIAGIEPGKPIINLSVGEPQHSALRRSGDGGASQRIRPLSGQQGP
jgi:hypothetical protein